jgi:hypothetical protein
MSTSIPWSKFIFSTLIILSSYLGFNNGQEMKDINIVNYQDGIQTKGMVSNCQPNSDEYCYLTEAVELILFGEKKNKTDIDTFLDMLRDNDTLDSVLQRGLEKLYSFAQDNPTLVPGEIGKRQKSIRLRELVVFLFQVTLTSYFKI